MCKHIAAACLMQPALQLCPFAIAKRKGWEGGSRPFHYMELLFAPFFIQWRIGFVVFMQRHDSHGLSTPPAVPQPHIACGYTPLISAEGMIGTDTLCSNSQLCCMTVSLIYCVHTIRLDHFVN